MKIRFYNKNAGSKESGEYPIPASSCLPKKILVKFSKNILLVFVTSAQFLYWWVYDKNKKIWLLAQNVQSLQCSFENFSEISNENTFTVNLKMFKEILCVIDFVYFVSQTQF